MAKSAKKKNMQHPSATTPMQEMDDVAASLLAKFVGLEAPAMPQHIRDALILSEPDLKRAYPLEFNSWRSRRLDAKKTDIPWSSEFDRFSVFLQYVGPKPDPTYTLDKIVKETGYVPGNVRWASKAEQALNRDYTQQITVGNETLTIPEWSKKTGISENTIRSRLRRGWPMASVISGHYARAIRASGRSLQARDHPWPSGYEEKWEGNFQDQRYDGERRIQFYVRKTEEQLERTRHVLERLFIPEYMREFVSDEECELSDKWQRAYNLMELFHRDARQKWRDATAMRPRSSSLF